MRKTSLFSLTIIVILIAIISFFILSLFSSKTSSNSFVKEKIINFCINYTNDSTENSFFTRFCHNFLDSSKTVAKPDSTNESRIVVKTLPQPKNDDIDKNTQIPQPKSDSQTNQYLPPLKVSNTLINGTVSPSSDKTFTRLSSQYTNKESFVHQAVHDDLIKMINDAKKDGVKLEVVSAFSSYHH